MNKKEIFDRIKKEHPNWSDEQVWAKVSVEINSAEVIEKAGADVDVNDKSLMESILRAARRWLEDNLPFIFEKLRVLFDGLLQNLSDWVQKGIEYVFRLIGEYC